MSLRDRIAAAIMDSCHGVFVDDAVHAADAVIGALGLTKEDEYNPHDPFPPPYRVRYVTEWTAGD